MTQNNKIRIISFPEMIEMESLMDPSLLLLGPVLGSNMDILEYVKTHIENTLSDIRFPENKKLNIVTTRYLGENFNDINEAEYNEWVTTMIDVHVKRDPGRVVLVMIPRGDGTVVNPIRGYARHTSFELGYLLGVNARLSVYIENGFCEYKYYYHTIMGIKPGLPIWADPLQAIQDALMMVLKTDRVSENSGNTVTF